MHIASLSPDSRYSQRRELVFVVTVRTVDILISGKHCHDDMKAYSTLHLSGFVEFTP